MLAKGMKRGGDGCDHDLWVFWSSVAHFAQKDICNMIFHGEASVFESDLP